MSLVSQRRAAGAVAIAILACAVALAPGPAGAYVTPKKCGTVRANGKEFAVRAHVVSCDFARPKSRAYLRYGRKPAGWSCRRYSASVTRIAFVCRRGRKDFYAIRR